MVKLSFPVYLKDNKIKLSSLLDISPRAFKLGKAKYLINAVLLDDKFYIHYVEVSRSKGIIIENSFVPISKVVYQENKIFISINGEEFLNIDTPFYQTKLTELTLKGLKYFGFCQAKIRLANLDFPLVDLLINPFEWRIESICFKKGLFKTECIGIEKIASFDDKNFIFYSKM